MNKGRWIIILLIILMLTSCKNISQEEQMSSKNIVKNEKKVNSVTNLFLDELEKEIEYTYSSVRVIPFNCNSETQQYIILLKIGSNWADYIWYVEYNGNKILNKFEIQDVSGNILSCREIKLNQGTYVEFVQASNVGNGNVVLWDLETKTIKYEFDYITVDTHREGCISKKEIRKYNLQKELGTNGQGYSFIYQGGMMNSVYKDINEDGKEDVIFYGITNVVYDEDEIPIKSFFEKKVFLYDKAIDNFVRNDGFDVTKEIK